MGRRKDSWVDDVADLFEALPWWVGLLVIGFVYFVMTVILPAQMHSQAVSGETAVAMQMGQNVERILAPMSVKLAPVVSLALLALWAGGVWRQYARRTQAGKTLRVERLRSMSWLDFERLIGELYRRRGCRVEPAGGALPDGGVDLMVYAGDRCALVQCKDWKAFKVGVKPARELLGVVTKRNAARGVLVTSGRFTREARAFAEGTCIELIDGEMLVEMLNSAGMGGEQIRPGSALEGPLGPASMSAKAAVAAPSALPAAINCPLCGSPMELRTARRGPNLGNSFYGCVQYPRCRGVRDAAM